MFRFRIAWVGEENCLSAVRKLFRGVWECGGQDSFESVSRHLVSSGTVARSSCVAGDTFVRSACTRAGDIFSWSCGALDGVLTQYSCAAES